MIIDLHCDTAAKLYDCGGSLAMNTYAVDLQRLRDARYDAQCFALFASDAFDAGIGYDSAARNGALWARLRAMAARLRGELSANADSIALALSYADVASNRASGRLSALLTVEDAGAFASAYDDGGNGGSAAVFAVAAGGERAVPRVPRGTQPPPCGGCRAAAVPAALREAHTLGVRIVTLVWNYPNIYANPHTAPRGGLTERGFALLRECEALRITVDVSHMNVAGFWDVAEHSHRPFLATHSNARALCDHTRNLDDAQLRAVAASGGVTGLCYYPPFVGAAAPTVRDSVARNAAHIVNVAGEDSVALGSDFDGFATPRGVNGGPAHSLVHAADVPCLADALAASGLTARQIDKAMWGNADRFLKDVL